MVGLNGQRLSKLTLRPQCFDRSWGTKQVICPRIDLKVVWNSTTPFTVFRVTRVIVSLTLFEAYPRLH